MKLQGIIPPVVTPMTADEELDLPGLRRHIDFCLERGVDGIFVLGTTGEFYALDEAEKQRVIATAVEHVNGRAPVYAGTGAETTREVLRLTKMAEKERVAGVSVITPYFLKPTQAELIHHFRSVAESTSLPVILYNNPATCAGVTIEVDTVAKLAEIRNIVGIKDSSGDLQGTIEMVKRTPQDFAVLMGRDTLILAGLMFGTQGAIPASANLSPTLAVGIYQSFRKGDLVAARSFQDRLTHLRLVMPFATGNGAIKESMALLGRPAGPSRSPITAVSPDKHAKIREALRAAGVEE